jgi:hypothetical protein
LRDPRRLHGAPSLAAAGLPPRWLQDPRRWHGAPSTAAAGSSGDADLGATASMGFGEPRRWAQRAPSMGSLDFFY